MSFQSLRPCLKPVTNTTAATTIRQFSTIPPMLSNQIPPESPSYIRLPQPRQYEETTRQRVRGFLPVPREIFPKLDGNRKIQPSYLSKTAAPPAKQPKLETKEQRWKYKMAQQRRSNLESGLQSLWQRKVKTEKVYKARTKAKVDAHRAASMAPEREDERLTRGTVLQSLLDTKVYLDPNRFAKADRALSKVMAAEAAKKESRRDALLELYISAKNFITDEASLKKEIDEIFTEAYFKDRARGSTAMTHNAWGIHGNPPTVINMLATARGSSDKLIHAHDEEYNRPVDRQKRVAQELTGGALE